MIRRLYAHNFRCLENFDLRFDEGSSVLLIGRNGAGKSTVRRALEFLQKIARGTNRVSEILGKRDFTRLRTDLPMRFIIEVQIAEQLYAYDLLLEWPEAFKEVRIAEESLLLSGQTIFKRKLGEVQIKRNSRDANFGLDWHLAALPTVQETSESDPIFQFKRFLQRMLILQPIPSRIIGDSEGESLHPTVNVSNFGEWFTGLLAFAPSAFTTIDSYLKEILPDIVDIKNPLVGRESRNIFVQFQNEQGSLEIPFEYLSDGEKCYMICALTLAANKAYGPIVCFWDEPDNHLALSEVGHFIVALRKGFLRNAKPFGQFIATSHHPETIRKFTDANTIVLTRKNHLEPTVPRQLKDLQIEGDLIDSLIMGAAE